jgi:alpha-beta hydrolase superfamily lysophospholipase
VSALELLPYFLAVEPSPTDEQTALALVRPGTGSNDVCISIVLEDRSSCTEIFRFTLFSFVRMAWSHCGRSLAVAHDSTLIVRASDGTLSLATLPREVEWLGFDRERLWSLAGGRLEARLGGRVVATRELVDCAAADGLVAYCRQEPAGLCVYVLDGDDERRLACLRPPFDLALVNLSISGDHLIVVLAGPAARERAPVRIVAFELTSSATTTLLDAHLAFGFNGGPGIRAVVLPRGEVLAEFEDGGCTRLWSLASGRPAEPVSPDAFEVFDFVANARGERIAVIASDTRTARGGSERHLLIGRSEDDGWRFGPPRVGVHEWPRWAWNSGLAVLRGDDGRWARSTLSPADQQVTADVPTGYASSAVSAGGVDYDIVRLPGPRHRRAAIVLLSRLHQQFVAGAQSFFFHHLISAVGHALARDGYDVVILNGPGAIGRGRTRREPSRSYLAELAAAFDHLLRGLHADGERQVGIIAGSMAAVAALRLAGAGSPLSACAFVAPLFDASIPLTAGLRHHLVDDEAVEAFDVAASELSVPSLVVHGTLDNVAPFAQTSELARQVRDPQLVELCLLDGEGHIFQRPGSWQQTHEAIAGFFAVHLATDDGLRPSG